MSRPRRDNNRTEPRYTTAHHHENNATRLQHPHTRHTRATPPPAVVAAAEFLLTQPDAHLYRRRYLELITHTPNPDGTTTLDYTAAENYLLTTATRHRKTLRPSPTLNTTPTPSPTGPDDPAPDDNGQS